MLRRGDDELDSWPVARLGRSDLAVIDDLTRMHVTARQLGCELVLREPCPKLVALLGFVGLLDVLHVELA